MVDCPCPRADWRAKRPRQAIQSFRWYYGRGAVPEITVGQVVVVVDEALRLEWHLGVVRLLAL